jgi:hypothetical protein
VFKHSLPYGFFASMLKFFVPLVTIMLP